MGAYETVANGASRLWSFLPWVGTIGKRGGMGTGGSYSRVQRSGGGTPRLVVDRHSACITRPWDSAI